MNKKLLVIGGLIIGMISLFSCDNDDITQDSTHVTDVSKIDSIVLKPQNTYLIANGKCTLDLTPILYTRTGKVQAMVIRDRIKDDWLEYSCPQGVKISRYLTLTKQDLVGKTIDVIVKIKGTQLQSKPVSINIVSDKTTSLKPIVFPVVFHIFTEEGQEEKTGISYSEALFNDIINKWNMVFGNKISSNPVGVDTHIQFKMAVYDRHGVKLNQPGIHRIYLPIGTFTPDTNFYDLIKNNDATWPSDKYINVWINGNNLQEASDMQTSLCYPYYNQDNPLEGVQKDPHPFTKMFEDIHNGIIFPANEIKQLNKNYSVFGGYKPGFNELIHYLGIYFGLINNNDFGDPFQGKPNVDGINHCPDVPVYHKADNYFNKNETAWKETDLCFFWSDNIMDDPTGFHTTISQDQALRMRWIVDHCQNRSSWKSNYAFTGKQ